MSELEDLLARLTPRVLAAVGRRYGHFDSAEDAVQEALVAAAAQWPNDGIPGNPLGWLIAVASRRLTDLLRSEAARARRERSVVEWTLSSERLAAPADTPVADVDDTLVLLFLCCHPSLTVASQIALTLRAVGGLTTAEIARAFLVPEATLTRRITRAKERIRTSGEPFRLPGRSEWRARLNAVLHVLYLVFNEGYASTAGPTLQRVDLVVEAIRLARMIHRMLPDETEVAGLLALMLLTDARRPARTGADGSVVLLAEQDRTLWNRTAIDEGVALITGALAHGPPGPYQLQAAIAALHDEAPAAEATDWPQIVALYELLLQIADNPVVALNHAVAVAMVRGPRAGLDLLAALETDERLAHDHRLHAARAHLLEIAGERARARHAYQVAARLTASLPVQRHLNARAVRMRD